MSTENLVLVVLALIAALVGAIEGGAFRRPLAWVARKPLARLATVALVIAGVVAAAFSFGSASRNDTCDKRANAQRDGAC